MRKMVPWKSFICHVIVLVVVSFFIGSPIQAADEITLKFADPHPLTHFVSVHGHQQFVKRVEQLTAGKVKVKHFPAEQLGKEKDFVELARKGITDVIYTSAGLSSGKLPLTAGGELPGMGPDVVRNSKAFQTLLNSNSLVFEEFQRAGLRPIMGFLWPPYEILTGRKAVQKIADLKGLKIRVNSAVMGSSIEALGGTAVTLTAAEIFEALQRGTTDGTTFTYMSAKSWKLEEVIKYGTVGVDVGGPASFYAINENTWKKLPDDIKKVIDRVGVEISANVSLVLEKESADIILEWEKKGKNLYHLTAADQAEWGKKLNPVIEQWITTQEARGLPARKSVEQLWKIRKEIK